MFKHILQTGQYYSLGASRQTDDDSTIEIEIVQRHKDRVTFAVWERAPFALKATAQGSATVPASWLEATLEAHRAQLLTECAGHAPIY